MYSSRTAIFLTLLATLFWGSNFQAAKLALESIPPWTAAFERFAIAVVGIFLLLILQETLRWSVLRQNFVAFAVLGLIGIAGFNGSLFIGLQTSSPLTASLIMATTPISTNIIDSFISRRFPTIERIVGILVSVLGVFLVITNGQVLAGNIDFSRGDLIVFAGSLCWATYTVGTRVFVRGSTPLETTGWTMFFGTLALGYCASMHESLIGSIAETTGISVVATLWMGIAGSVLAYLFWNIGIAVRGAGKTAIFFNFVPVFALIIAIYFGALPQLVQIIGVLITILGVLVGQGHASTFGKFVFRSTIGSKDR